MKMLAHFHRGGAARRSGAVGRFMGDVFVGIWLGFAVLFVTGLVIAFLYARPF